MVKFHFQKLRNEIDQLKNHLQEREDGLKEREDQIKLLQDENNVSLNNSCIKIYTEKSLHFQTQMTRI